MSIHMHCMYYTCYWLKLRAKERHENVKFSEKETSLEKALANSKQLMMACT